MPNKSIELSQINKESSLTSEKTKKEAEYFEYSDGITLTTD